MTCADEDCCLFAGLFIGDAADAVVREFYRRVKILSDDRRHQQYVASLRDLVHNSRKKISWGNGEVLG
jgi:hypothetical protein